MRTIIYVSGQNIRVVFGRMAGGTITVESVKSAAIPDACMLNGQLADEEALTECIRAFWNKSGFSGNDVTFLAGSGCGLVRTLLLPKMSHRNMMNYLSREFAAVEYTADPFYTYKILGEEDGRVRVLAVMLDRTALEPYIRCLRRAGLRVRSVGVDLIAVLTLLKALPCTQDKSCVVQMLDGRDLVSMLFVRGAYYHFTRARMTGEPGTPVFGVEAARAVSSMKLFLQTQYPQDEISHVYLGDGFDRENLEICREIMEQMDERLEIEGLCTDGELSMVQTAFRLEADVLGHYFTGIAGLTVLGDGRKLMRRIRNGSESARCQRAFLAGIAPAAVLAAILIAVAGIQAALCFALTERIYSQMDMLGDYRAIEAVVEYDCLKEENEALDSGYDAAVRSLENIFSYPVYTSLVRAEVEDCCKEGVAVRIEDYDGETGAVRICAETHAVMDVSEFVSRLERKTDLFWKIDYDGFVYDEYAGVWQAVVHAYLAAPDTNVLSAETEVVP